MLFLHNHGRTNIPWFYRRRRFSNKATIRGGMCFDDALPATDHMQQQKLAQPILPCRLRTLRDERSAGAMRNLHSDGGTSVHEA
jgi:hypothetical protein